MNKHKINIMAKQTVNIGVSSNDGSGDKLRVAFDKLNNNSDELYTRVQALETGGITASSLVRSAINIAATGAANQVIAFSSQFVGSYALQIIDYEGLGIEIKALDENGFTITPGSAGNFGYIALIEV
jgi:hypothetical protein